MFVRVYVYQRTGEQVKSRPGASLHYVLTVPLVLAS